MTIPAAATTSSRSTDSSTPVSETPAPAVDESQSQSVVPPVYMSTVDTLGQSTPNYDTISANQASYCEAVSSQAASVPDPTAVSSIDEAQSSVQPSPDQAAQQASEAAGTGGAGASEGAGGGDAASTEAGAAEDGEAGDAESVSEDGGVCEATDGEATDEEQATEDVEGDETGPAGSGAAAGSGSNGGSEEEKGIEAKVAKLPRMAPIRTPWVPSPPPQAIQRRDQIIKRTGSPPEQHHANVRQAVEHVSQAARDAQRRMVWQLSNVARDTRISIEDMAEEILKAMGAAIAQINAAIETAIDDVGDAAEDEVEHIEEHGVLTGEQLEQSRNNISAELAADLVESSEEVTRVNDVAQGRFTEYLSEANAKVLSIPDQGSVGRIAAPTSGASSGAGSSNPPPPPPPPAADAAPTYHTLAETHDHLTEFIDTQSTTMAEGRAKCKNLFTIRATPALDVLSERKHAQLRTGAQQNATNLGNPGARAQFTIMVLGLTTPVSEHHAQDQSHTVDANETAIREQMTEAEYAVRQASMTIYEKRDLATEYLSRDLRDNLTDNIRKSGHKAYKSLREQAASSEVALNSSAAPMAESYRDLVDRINLLLPPGQFLDSRDLIPKLLTARDSAEKMRHQHVAAGTQQSLETIKQMEQVKKDQVDGLIKSGQESANSVQDVVTQTSFDMSMFSSQMTGALSDGALNGMQAARDYATKSAKGMLNSVNEVTGPGLNRINQTAVGYLNGGISGAEQSQFQALSGFVEMMGQANSGPLVAPMTEANADLNRRTTALHTAMPNRSTTTAIGLGLASPIALGVYLYHTDASESGVIQQLGNLMWPGVQALEEVFSARGYGDLQGTIKDRLGNPEKGQALRLFSTSADVRGAARLEIAENSTHWYKGVNREARDSVLQGMSADERGSLDPAQLAEMRTEITGNLSGAQAELAGAYIDGNRDAAVAARTHEALDKAQGQGEWGWIFSAESARRRSDEARVAAIGQMDDIIRSELSVQSGFVDQTIIDSHHDPVVREFASLVDPRHRPASSFTAEQAQNTMIGYATRSHASAVIGFNPLGLIVPGMAVQAHVEQIDMGGDAHRYIEDAVRHGANSEEARVSRGVFEYNRAQGDRGWFGISNNTQTRLSDAFEDREFARLQRQVNEATTPQERSRAERELAEERVRHQARLQAIAGRLDAPADVAADPARAQAWMAQRMGETFASTNGLSSTIDHARYGEEMINLGRARLDTTVALASDGLGTHDDLLRRGYADRSHAEIREANKRWAQEHDGENMEEMLGIRQRQMDGTDALLMAASPIAWFATRGSETSGDLAMELEVLAQGNPETDMDYVNIANLRYSQQRERGTGFIAEHTMQGTAEQQYLDGSRERMARTILNEAIRHNPALAQQFGDNPSAIFNPDGSINAAVTRAAFNDRGEFQGDKSALQNQGNTISYAADAYRAEIDRQEAMITSGITILALAVSLALMLVPGVNIVAAGIITAIVAGTLTIVAKAGMRGGRYGWEEAATDVAHTAIEVATAGIGGSLAGGLGKTGALAKIGESMINSLGRVGGAVAREAIMGAISSAANTAMQDDIWNDGLGRGLEKVASGAVRGAIVSAVTTGISESITKGLNQRMNLANADPSKMTGWQRMASQLGPHGSEMLREGITNTVGNMAGEAVGLMVDYSQGNFHGTFMEALKQIGMTGLREMVTSTIRGGITSMHRENYHALLEAARNGGNLSDSQLKALRLFAISAGEMHYDQGLAHIRNEVEVGRNLLARIPPELRAQVTGLDMQSLQQLIGVISHGNAVDAATQKHNSEFIHGLTERIPGMKARDFMQEFNHVMAARSPHAASELEPAQQQHLRSQLAAHLNENVRFALDDVHVDGMQHLTEAELGHAAAMIAAGEFNSAVADHLLQAAKARNPQLDEFGFLNGLHEAVTNSRRVQETLIRGALERRQQVVALVPQEAAHVFAQLGDAEVAQAQKLIRSGNPGTPQEQDSLFHAARAANPELTRDQFHGFMEAAATKVRQQMETENHTRRAAREERMTHVPEELRGTLSALPEAALVELRLRQMEGNLSPAEKNRLLSMALRETPGVDLHMLGHALEQAVQHPLSHQLSEAETADLRRHLLSAIPVDQQTQIANTRIMVLPAEEFAAFTRSQKGQAVTLIINGEPVVIVREGANPRVLREEGIHALQAHNPDWAAHIGSLDERTMAQWDSLPLEQQLALYRNKVSLELNAQEHMIRSLEADIENASGHEKRALQQQLEQVRGAFENLSRRGREIGDLTRLDINNIKAGFSERPQWLEQPARLFNKGENPEAESQSRVRTEQEIRDELNAHIAGGGRVGREQLEITGRLSVEQLTHLVHLSGSDAETARALLSRANKSGNAGEFIQQLHHVMNGLSPAQQTAARAVWSKMHAATLTELLGGLHELRLQHSSDEHFQALIHAATTDGKIDLADVREFTRIGNLLAQAENPIPLSHIINHFSNPEELHTILYKLGGAADPAAMAGQLIHVLGALSPEQYAGVRSALVKLSPDVFTDVVRGFAHLANQVPLASSFHALVDVVMDARNNKSQLVENLVEVVSRLDVKGLHAMASLLDQTDVGMRGEFLDSLVIFSKITLRPLEQSLLGHDSGKLFNLLIETAATQRNWIVFMENAGELLMTMHNLPRTEANQEAINKTLRYLFDARGDLSQASPLHAANPADVDARFKTIRENTELLQLAADINVAASMLRNSPDREKTFNDLVNRQTTEGRLAGGDAWQSHLQNEALHWTAFKNDPATQDFANLLVAAAPGWSEGQLAAIRDMHVWFEHLATSRGIAPTDTAARTALMEEIFSRGFGAGRRNLSSEGKMTSLARAFRELTVEAHTGISLDPSATRDPVRMADALARLGLTEQQLAQRSDAETIRKHIYDLVTRQVYYDAMQQIAESIGGSTHGVKQNITEVIGEIALTQHMLANEPNFRLETPFGKGTGFDQVWARRDTTGHVVEFIVGEAKGPGAQLGTPGKGAQMSAEWVFNTVREMIASTDPATHNLGVEMMDAIRESRQTGVLIIRGVVIEAGNPPSSGSHNRSSPGTGQTGYDFSKFNLPLSGP